MPPSPAGERTVWARATRLPAPSREPVPPDQQPNRSSPTGATYIQASWILFRRCSEGSYVSTYGRASWTASTTLAWILHDLSRDVHHGVTHASSTHPRAMTTADSPLPRSGSERRRRGA